MYHFVGSAATGRPAEASDRRLRGSPRNAKNAGPMRVLFVVGQFPVLSETFILDQVTGLIDRGFDVTILGTPPDPNAPKHRAIAEYGLEARTRYAPGNVPGWLRAAPALFSDLSKRPGDGLRALAHSLDVRARGVEGLALLPIHRAAVMRDAGPFDAVVAHFGPNGLKALSLRALGVTRAPIATFFHGYDLSRWQRGQVAGRYAPLFRETERMLPISQRWRERLIELGCAPDKIRVHPMGVHTSRFAFEPRSVTGGPGAELRVLSVGRLVEKKGFEHGLRGIARAAEELPNLRYDLVGAGPLAEDLKRLARELGVADRVVFHGHLAREQVESIRSAAHVMLVPSVTARDGDQEGIPVVIMEAMASGLPVIASRHSGIPELVVDGETGLLVPEGDAASIAGAIARLSREEGLARRLADRALESVRAIHDADRLNDVFAEELKDLARRAGAC